MISRIRFRVSGALMSYDLSIRVLLTHLLRHLSNSMCLCFCVLQVCTYLSFSITTHEYIETWVSTCSALQKDKLLYIHFNIFFIQFPPCASWRAIQRARYVDPMLVWFCASIVDGGPTVNYIWGSVSYLLGTLAPQGLITYIWWIVVLLRCRRTFHPKVYIC